eukprot:jgi/Botrbrau1/10987/Bobra.0234s0012.1
MQPSQCFKSEGLESHRRLLTRQQDSIAGLLVLGSARGGPTRHEVQQVGNCEWGRANDSMQPLLSIIRPLSGLFGVFLLLYYCGYFCRNETCTRTCTCTCDITIGCRPINSYSYRYYSP